MFTETLFTSVSLNLNSKRNYVIWFYGFLFFLSDYIRSLTSNTYFINRHMSLQRNEFWHFRGQIFLNKKFLYRKSYYFPVQISLIHETPRIIPRVGLHPRDSYAILFIEGSIGMRLECSVQSKDNAFSGWNGIVEFFVRYCRLSGRDWLFARLEGTSLRCVTSGVPGLVVPRTYSWLLRPLPGCHRRKLT